jgi:flagella basal body P-ring formation protein FlgA
MSTREVVTAMENKTNILAVAVMAVACFSRVSLAATAVAALDVHPQAVVQGEKVLLADLAGIEGLDEATMRTMRQIEVAGSPAPGEAENLDVELVRKALVLAKVNLSDLCIGGSASCKVYRPAAPSSEQLATASSKAPRPGQEEPRTVEAAARKALGDRLVKFEGQVEVRFGQVSKGVLGLGGKDVVFNVRPRTGALLGLLNVEVDIVEAGKVARTVPVMAEVALTKGVVVARRPINRGSMVRAEDVGLEERRFTKIEDLGLITTAGVLGREAKRYIDRGEMLTTRDVQAMPLVRRGEYVTVWFHRGGLSVRGSAKALKEGVQGERIEVKSDPGGQVYAVVVTGPKTVEADAATGGELLSRAD